jgi:hypothetical protein
MTRYSKMQAPPLWMWMFRIVGMLCLVTLLTPTFYLVKYAVVDRPYEQHIAGVPSRLILNRTAFTGATDYYIRTAENSSSIANRLLAVKNLGSLAGSTMTQITHPVECLRAKLTLEQVASKDVSPEVRISAQNTLMRVASHGAVIQR